MTNSTCVYNLSKVKFKFLGDKKGPMEGFLSWSLENSLTIFVSSLSFELSKLFLYLLRFVFTCVVCDGVNIKRDQNMILNSHGESFSKTGMFLQAFQKLPQNVQQKIGRCR